MPDVLLTSNYDADGNRTSLSAQVGGTPDFVNSYQYDFSNREVQVTQGAVSSVQVTGNGYITGISVNGTYAPLGSLHGQPTYSFTPGNPSLTFYLWFNGTNWIIGDNVPGLFRDSLSNSTSSIAGSAFYPQPSNATGVAIAIADNVDPKTVQFTYDADGEVATINRFNALTAASANEVAQSDYGYDSLGLVTSLTEAGTNGASPPTFANDVWTYYANGEVESFLDNYGAWRGDDITNYTYDKDGQLTGDAPAINNCPNSVTNTYNLNGNPSQVWNAVAAATATTSVGASGNTLLYDGTNSYQYDADGNVILSWPSSIAESQPTAADTGTITAYTWDNRGRVASATTYNGYANYSPTLVPNKIVTYTYDMFNNLIGRTVSSPGEARNVMFLTARTWSWRSTAPA